jgi:hypothetical protein
VPDPAGVAGDVTAESEAALLDVRAELKEGGYAMGEAMVMRLVAANRTDRALKIIFATGQQYDFIVRRGRMPVWRWSEGRDFGIIPEVETVEPGDSLVFEYRWDQALSDGTTPPLGRYTLQGILKTKPEVESAEVTFGIVD